jgi:DNA-binding FadR family transcriptional regulator
LDTLSKYPHSPGSSAAILLADKLREAVLTEFASGELLGSEDELVARYGVSRPTLRQAMRVLQAEGLIGVRRGNSGGFFARTPSVQALSRLASLMLRHQGATRQHLLEMSQLIGPEIALAAAAIEDAEQRAAFAASIENMWADAAELDHQTWLRLAVEFGRRLGEICPNPALALFGSVLADLVWTNPAVENHPEDDGKVSALRAAHMEIAAAVALGNGVGAKTAMAELSALAVSWS